jgi:O-methyltransferase
MNIALFLKRAIKDVLCATNSKLLRYWLPAYYFNLPPAALNQLCDAISQTRDLSGPVLEIGCANGATTVFLNKHMDELLIEKPYICIDTFDGFSANDIRFEAVARGKKNKAFLERCFADNKREWFMKTLELNRIRRVQVLQQDVVEYSFEAIENVSVCFIDVDLYRPVKSALEKVWPLMARGGIIVVDDCSPSQPGCADHFDGAYQAFLEFSSAHGLAPTIVHARLGLIVA